jgi:RNA polymerase sigma-70 factor (ECF subfamily)
MASSSTVLELANSEGWTDEDVVARILQGEAELFEVIMRRHNRRLYRAALAILGDDAEAEDVMQDTYVRAYQHLDQFAGRARFSTWLTRIAVHEAFARSRRRKTVVTMEDENIAPEPRAEVRPDAHSPETELWRAEMGRVLESAILAIPEIYRTVLVLRDLEDMSTADTAAALDLSEENVKVRLHRARALVRKQLMATMGSPAPPVFEFMGERCDQMVRRVFARLLAEKLIPARASI